ncbi:MAG: hypothetical protein ACR2GL_05950, partial [Thermoleophilaceae bacterium]
MGSRIARQGDSEKRVRALDHDEQMAKHRVSALILDEHNLAEIARHGVSAGEVLQIDEQTAEVHDGHPVEFLVSVRLDPEESRLLSELAEAEGADPP